MLWVILISLGVIVSGGESPFRSFFPNYPNLFVEYNTTGSPLFLTPYIKSGKIQEARELSKVIIPNHDSVEGYSGYLAVNKPSCASNLFFWYFPAKYLPKTAPLLLWLQGGPGGSSLFGLFIEHGPFIITENLDVRERNTAWSLTHNIIYLDQPVGTGFSFTKLDECYATNETDVAKDIYEMLFQFFQLFPETKSNEFYITGESYAGKYVPAIASYIHEQNPLSAEKDKINLVGIAIGDGLCDPLTMTNYGDFLYNVGLIDEAALKVFKIIEAKQIEYIKNKEWEKAFRVFDSLLNGDESGYPSFFTNATGLKYYFNYLLSNSPQEFNYYPQFLEKPEIRKAIHVGGLTYNDGSIVEKHLIKDIMKSVKPLVESLLKNYRVMIYNGQTDIIIAWPLTESFITSMKWSGADEYITTKRKI
ncbi:probable serine carboxypeptidase CPVL isoform X2 [Lepeophtheirus salmonis]|nr:probable serine carboxypeptidase CPVL isoform X2 [Lepeophtheirus salmonis]